MTGFPLSVTTWTPVGSDGMVAVGRSVSVRVVVLPPTVIAIKLYVAPDALGEIRDCGGCVVVILAVPLTVVRNATPTTSELLDCATNVIDAGQ